MIKQIEYVIQDINNNKNASIILLFQMGIALILIAYILNIVLGLEFFRNSLLSFSNYENMYLINDVTEESKIDELYYDKNVVSKQKDFYRFITESENWNAYVCLPDVYMSDKSKPSGFKEVRINNNTIELYNLKCSKGRMFIKSDFNSTDDRIPILIGSKLGKDYEIGDVIEKKYEVVGVLQAHSYYYDMHYGAIMISLDEQIVMPIQVNKYDAFSDFHMLAGYTYIMTNDSQILDTITKKLLELDLYSFELISFKEYLITHIDHIKEYVYSIMFFLIIVLMFSIICTIFNLLQYIEERRREFVLHLLCGAHPFELVKRIFIQTGIGFFITDCIIFLLYKASYVALITITIGLVIHLVICILPCWRLMNFNISYEMRKK